MTYFYYHGRLSFTSTFRSCLSRVTRYKQSITVLFILPLLLISQFAVAEEQGKASSPIRIVMSAAFVSEAGIDIYDEIARYLEKKLNKKAEFISGFSYSTINNMLTQGMADIGFVCGLPYVLAKEDSKIGIDLLVAPVMKDARYQGKPEYFSYVIVRKDSTFQRFSDLAGSRFVYNDEISNSGYNMPRAYMIEQGKTKGFFGEILRSGSHEESIRMVASGKADASAVDSLVFDYDKLKNPVYVSQTRIIKVLGPASIPPVVVSAKMPLPLRNDIKEILLDMNKDPAGKAILEKALLDKFVAVEDSQYDDIRNMRNMSKKSGFLEIR